MPKIPSSENGTLVTLFSTKSRFEQDEQPLFSDRQKRIATVDLIATFDGET